MQILKIPYLSDYNFNELLKQYNNVIHFAFNRFQENLKQKEIEKLVSNLKNISLLSKRIQLYAVCDAKFLFSKHKNNKVIFGGKFNFLQRCLNKITKEQFQENKLSPINFQGEINQNGNRYFQFDLENNQIIFKLKCKQHINLKLPNLSKNYYQILSKINYLIKNKQIGYSIKLTKTHICIGYDESLLKLHREFQTKSNRILGIDLNPNYIGCSVLEFDKNNKQKVLYKWCYDLSKLTVKSGESSSHKNSKYLHNKLKHEYFQIIKDMVNKCKSYQVKNISVESLSFKNKFFSKELNRLCKGKWLKTTFVNNLQKWCNIYNLKCVEINSAYSSVIGNINYHEFDPISASIEIARRGFECYIQKKKDRFYPKFDKEYIKQWCLGKNIIVKGVINDWKELYQFLKKSEIRYRISLNKYLFKVFSLNSIKSNVLLYNSCKIFNV